MNSTPSPDPLAALWRTAPKPDTQHLLRDLRRFQRRRQQLKRTVLTILSLVTILLILAEATGRFETHGILSAIWILMLAAGVGAQRRARCKRVDVLSLDTVSLLKVMLARAKSDLALARWLYAGAPCGALAGGVVTKLAGGASQASGIHARLNLMITGAGAAVLIGMVLTGVVLARSTRLQMKALSEKLRSVEAGQ